MMDMEAQLDAAWRVNNAPYLNTAAMDACLRRIKAMHSKRRWVRVGLVHFFRVCAKCDGHWPCAHWRWAAGYLGEWDR